MGGPFVTASGAKQSRKIGEIIWLPGFAAVMIGG